MKFCAVCHYYLYLQPDTYVRADGATAEKLMRICRSCGYQEDDAGGLVLETDLKEKTSEGYKIMLNEFTQSDPTLPHLDTIKCPNGSCSTNTAAAQKDVIYLKYDTVNLKYLYICNVCNHQWRSK